MIEQGLVAHDETGALVLGPSAGARLHPLAMEHFALFDDLDRVFSDAMPKPKARRSTRGM